MSIKKFEIGKKYLVQVGISHNGVCSLPGNPVIVKCLNIENGETILLEDIKTNISEASSDWHKPYFTLYSNNIDDLMDN